MIDNTFYGIKIDLDISVVVSAGVYTVYQSLVNYANEDGGKCCNRIIITGRYSNQNISLSNNQISTYRYISDQEACSLKLYENILDLILLSFLHEVLAVF